MRSPASRIAGALQVAALLVAGLAGCEATLPAAPASGSDQDASVRSDAGKDSALEDSSVEAADAPTDSTVDGSDAFSNDAPGVDASETDAPSDVAPADVAADDGPVDSSLPDAPADPCALDKPGEAWLAFVSWQAGNYDVYASHTDGTCLRALTTDPADDLHPSWSPSGKEVLFMSERNQALNLYVLDTVTHQERLLDVGSLRPTAPAWSPDGAWVVFEARPEGSLVADIYKVPAAGGATVQLTNDSDKNSGPIWSPDGSTIYFIASKGGWYEIHSIPADGGPKTQVTHGAWVIGKPAISRDGAYLAYATLPSGSTKTAVKILDLAAQTTRELSALNDAEPAFDPTGANVAVTSYRYGNPDIVILDFATGQNALQVTTSPNPDGMASFRPLVY